MAPGITVKSARGNCLARLRIGHTLITHSYLLKGEEAHECIPCNTDLTVKHLLIECIDLAPVWDKYFKVDSLKTLFDTVKLESLFDFLKETFLPLLRLLNILFSPVTGCIVL